MNETQILQELDTIQITIPRTCAFLYMYRLENKKGRTWLYTGITKNPWKRFWEHINGIKSGWKTSWHKNCRITPVYLEYLGAVPNDETYKANGKYEINIKRMSRENKFKLIKSDKNIVQCYLKTRNKYYEAHSDMVTKLELDDLDKLTYYTNLLKLKWMRIFWCMVLK